VGVLALATIVGGLIITSENPLARSGHPALGRGQHPGGLSCGLFNGVVCERWKIPLLHRDAGDAQHRAGRGPSDQQLAHDLLLPGLVHEVGAATIFGVPIIFLMALGVVLAGRFILNRTVFGRLIYAIGNNEEAVRLSGHAPSLYKVAAFTLCGGMVGLAAIMYMMRLNIASPILGVGFELNAIAAVVIAAPA